MEQYKKANEGIHAPDELKRRVVGIHAQNYRRKAWVGAVATVLVLAVLAGVIFWPGGGPLAQTSYASAIALPEYPDMPKRPTGDSYNPTEYSAWSSAVRAQKASLKEVSGENALFPFYTSTMQQFLCSSDGQNRVYSPLSLYLALAMTAELTDGNSRQQILDLLGVSDMRHLRKLANALWNANYRDDGTVTTRLASSLWLNENIDFVTKTMDTLADTYYAASFRGKMGSDKLDSDLQNWINDQTAGLLTDYTSNLELSSDTVLALVTTLYFNAKWMGKFNPEKNTIETFHGAIADTETEFMHGQNLLGRYYWGDLFSATEKQFESGGSMLLILPDEGVSFETLLHNTQFSSFLADGSSWENTAHVKVNLSIPKFDVSSQLDLKDGLKTLGITDIFDYEISDFSPLTKTVDQIFLGQALQAGRVIVDEDGVEATTYTLLGFPAGGLPPDEEIDFVLDRPFLFIIKSETGQFLFTGVVNQL